MPWCEPCAKYWTPAAMKDDGSCPSCGTFAQVADAHGRVTADNIDLKQLAGKTDDDAKAPWHFKLLVFMLLAYLGWRVVVLFQ
jgi:hypothetical protein